jgi:hypothetical protein
MTHPEIRLQILKLAFDIAREGTYAAVQDIEHGVPGSPHSRVETVAHVDDVLEIADSLIEFVFPDDDEFSDIVEGDIDFESEDSPSEI